MAEAGWFNGARSLNEQMLGLDLALAEAKGKTVLDLGCAEGLIGAEFSRAGASRVDMIDNNPTYGYAAKLLAKPLGLRFGEGDINFPLPAWLDAKYDIVLALAVIHKAKDVTAALRLCAGLASDLMVIRLPRKSTGVIKSKHFHNFCDLDEDMPAMGFGKESTQTGPRGELVQYWRKR